MELKRFMELLDWCFSNNLEKQTNWGRNQVKEAYLQAKSEASMLLLEELAEGKKNGR